MDVVSSLNAIKSEIPATVTLVAVSKTKSVEVILEAYQGGQRVFGENRVQEMVEKQAVLPQDIEWHHIGHLQTNKVKHLAPFVDMIHAVDSRKLLIEINKNGLKNKRVISCLLQIHIAEEDTKFGLLESELNSLLEIFNPLEFKNVKVCGLMGMSTLTDDESQIKREFGMLKKLFDDVQEKYVEILPDFNVLSMGMSGDYPIAIEEGSTMIRVGSLIFGSRH